jgi:hypothetical protein
MPYEEPFPFTKVNETLNSPLYQIIYAEKGEKFFLKIIRTSSQETIFDTSLYSFVYSNLYLEIGTYLSSIFFYGMGERRSHFLYETGKYSTWNFDHPSDLE